MGYYSKYVKGMAIIVATIYSSINAANYELLPSIEVNLEILQSISQQQQNINIPVESNIDKKITPHKAKSKNNKQAISKKKTVPARKIAPVQLNNNAQKPQNPVAQPNVTKDVKPQDNSLGNSLNKPNIPFIPHSNTSNNINNNQVKPAAPVMKPENHEEINLPAFEPNPIENKSNTIKSLPTIEPSTENKAKMPVIDEKNVENNVQPSSIKPFHDSQIELPDTLPMPTVPNTANKSPVTKDIAPEVKATAPQVPIEEEKIKLPEPPKLPSLSHANNDSYYRINFAKSEFNLDNKIKNSLDNILASAQKTDAKLKIIGFGDNDELVKPNDARKVALQRVIAIRKYLIEKGVSSDKINVQAVGKDNQENTVGRVDVFLEEFNDIQS